MKAVIGIQKQTTVLTESRNVNSFIFNDGKHYSMHTHTHTNIHTCIKKEGWMAKHDEADRCFLQIEMYAI